MYSRERIGDVRASDVASSGHEHEHYVIISPLNTKRKPNKKTLGGDKYLLLSI